MDMETNINMENGSRQILVEFPPVEEKLDIWYLDEERERRANRIFAIHAACSLLGIVLASLILARYILE